MPSYNTPVLSYTQAPPSPATAPPGSLGASFARDRGELAPPWLVNGRISDENPLAVPFLELGQAFQCVALALPGGLRLKRRFLGTDTSGPFAVIAPRGPIRGFSRHSRRRLTVLLQGIPFELFYVSLSTLTYPDEFPTDPRQWKRDLQTWYKRFRYTYPQAIATIWRLELVPRKTGVNRGKLAPHYHLLTLWPRGSPMPPLAELQLWTAASWHAVAAPLVAAHAQAGTSVIMAHNTDGPERACLLLYLAKDMAKPARVALVDPQTGELLNIGRSWGVFGELPHAVLGAYDLTPDAWRALCDRVNASGVRCQSPYLQAISPRWEGFAISGDGALLAQQLLEGLAGVTPRPDDIRALMRSP